MTASNQRVSASPGVATKATTKIDWTAAWVTNSPPCVEEQRRRHRAEDDDADLPGPGPDEQEKQVCDEQPHRHADGDLRDAPQPLRIRRPQADDRDDRREHGPRVMEHRRRDEPRERRRHGALADVPRLAAHPLDPLAYRSATAAPRAVHQRVDSVVGPGRAHATDPVIAAADRPVSLAPSHKPEVHT
jgi:hypothetical protein